MKFRTKIIIGITAVILANTMFAYFAFAQLQTPGPVPGGDITQKQLIDMSNKSIDLVEKRRAGNDIFSELDALKKQCLDVGSKLESLGPVGGLTLQTWMHSVTLQCYWGAKTGGNNPSDILGSNRGVIKDDGADNLRVMKMTNKTMTDLTSIQKVRQEAYNNATKPPSSWDILNDSFGRLIGGVLTFLFGVLTSAVLSLVALAGMALNFSLQHTAGSYQPAMVYQGWVIVRDVMNMFFILAIIVMSIATILRRPENYNSRKLILNLILMALLINFSKVIAETLIRAADMLTQLFAGNTYYTWTDQFGRYFHALVYNSNGSFGVNQTGMNLPLDNVWGGLTRGIIQLVTALLMLASFGTVAILLVIRLVSLWVLVMLSPIAYALAVLPNTSNYSRMWWSYFVKYLIWAPVAIFFFYMGQLMINAKDIIKLNNSFDALFIAIWFFGALWVIKKAGMVGSEAILKGADSLWKGGGTALSKYALRGSMVRQAGIGLQKVTGGRVTGLKTFGDKWQKAAQFAEATPGALKEGFANAEKKYQSDVKKSKRQILAAAGLLDTSKEGLGELSTEEAYAKARELFKPGGRGTASDLKKWGTSLSDDGFKGLVKAGLDGHLDPGWQGNIETILRKRENIGDNVAGKVFNSGIDPTTGAGMNVTTNPDGSYKIEYNYQQPIPGGTPDPRRRMLNAGSDKQALKPEEAAKLEQEMADKQEKMRRTEEFYKGVENDPEGDRKILEAESSGRIYNVGEMTQVSKMISATHGVGERVDIEESRVASNGAKVFMSKEAASKIKLEPGQDANIPADQVDQVVNALKGEISPMEEDMIRQAAKKMGSVNVFRGVMEPLKSYMTKSETRLADSERKQHETLHMFMGYLQKTKPQTYTNVVNKVVSDPKFGSLKEQIIKENKVYSGYSDTQIAEEVLARKNTYAQVQAVVDPLISPERSGFRNQIRQTLKGSGLEEKAVTVQQRIIERVGTVGAGAPLQNVAEAARQMTSAAAELNKATGGISGVASQMNSATDKFRESSDLQMRQSKLSNTDFKKAVQQFETGTKLNTKQFGDAARTQTEAAMESAEQLKSAANALKKQATKPSAPDLNAPPSLTNTSNNQPLREDDAK